MHQKYIRTRLSSRSLVIFITLGMALVASSSCNRFVDIPLPEDQVESATVFKDDKTALSAMIGVYAQIMGGNLTLANGGMSLYCGLSADDIYNTQQGSAGNPFFDNALVSDNSVVYSNFWTSSYKNIYQLNAILEGLADSHTLTDSVKSELMGESEFIRAFYYFYLVNLFGEVPLATSTNYQQNAALPRSPVSKVYQKIISDLTDAMQQLPESYSSGNRIRPNRFAATALLARVSLFQSEWGKVDTLTSQIIQSPLYNLNATIQDVFLPDNPGIIWQLEPVGYYNTAEGNAFIPFSNDVVPNYALTNYVLRAFDATDLRRKYWVDSCVVDNKIYYYPYKYKVSTGSAPYLEYNVVLRLAEVYLMRAEARAHLDDISGALQDLNQVRERAGLAALVAPISEDSCERETVREWRVAFFAEWGHRWLDLKRTESCDRVLGTEKTGWQSSASLYPIPLADINRDPKLTQNAGY